MTSLVLPQICAVCAQGSRMAHSPFLLRNDGYAPINLSWLGFQMNALEPARMRDVPPSPDWLAVAVKWVLETETLSLLYADGSMLISRTSSVCAVLPITTVKGSLRCSLHLDMEVR